MSTITWNITVNSTAGTTRFTTSDSFVDLGQLQVGDYVNIVGSQFSSNNRGSFSVTAVDVRYSGSTLTQYFEISNVGVVQSGVTQTTSADIVFFRPSVSLATSGSRTAVVSMTEPDVLDVILPATSLAVNRGPTSAAYLQPFTPVTISSITRLPSGVATVTTATAHGLSTGANILIDGTFPTPGRPSPTAGNGTSTTDYSPVSIWSSVANMSGTALHGGASVVLSNKLMLIGGSNVSTANTTCRLFQVTASATQANGGNQLTYVWSTATSLPVATDSPSAGLLADGNVLMTGGWNGTSEFSTAYLYNVSGNTWSSSVTMKTARKNHAQVLLGDGRVLLVGGNNTGGTAQLTVCEIFQPSGTSGTFSSAGSLKVARSKHQAVKLSSGKVLAIGGSTETCELYDPSTDSWTQTGSMAYSRAGHVAITLPNDQILVVGGTGYPVSQPGTPNPIAAAEIYDANTGRWYRAGQCTARTDTSAVYLSSRGQVFVWGDGVSEYFNSANRVWSLAPASTNRKTAFYGLLPSGAVISAGGTISGTDSLTASIYIPNSDAVTGSGLNGQQTVASVPTSTTFTISTPAYLMYTAATGGTVTPTAAKAASTIPGPYLLDSTGVAVTGTTTTTTQSLSKGLQYRTIKVVAAASIPDAPGWVSLAFGTNKQLHIRYLGRVSNTELAIDYGQVMPYDYASGATVTLLSDINPFAPESPETTGALYLTGSAAGRVAASNAVDLMVAAGVDVNQVVVYPGDRGLGGEGYPAAGADKLSDKVSVWAGDDIDIDVADARGNQ
jgi:hypothetical protein